MDTNRVFKSAINHELDEMFDRYITPTPPFTKDMVKEVLVDNLIASLRSSEILDAERGHEFALEIASESRPF